MLSDSKQHYASVNRLPQGGSIHISTSNEYGKCSDVFSQLYVMYVQLNDIKDSGCQGTDGKPFKLNCKLQITQIH